MTKHVTKKMCFEIRKCVSARTVFLTTLGQVMELPERSRHGSRRKMKWGESEKGRRFHFPSLSISSDYGLDVPWLP